MQLLDVKQENESLKEKTEESVRALQESTDRCNLLMSSVSRVPQEENNDGNGIIGMCSSNAVFSVENRELFWLGQTEPCRTFLYGVTCLIKSLLYCSHFACNFC